jgi:NTE family protein
MVSIVLRKHISLALLLCWSCCINPTLAVETVETTPAGHTESRNYKFSGVAHPKIGLALGGGGARGAAHIGVLKVLEAEGIKADMVTGTSVGAVVGGFYCAGANIDEMKHSWESGDLMRSYMTVPLWFRVIMAPILYIPRLFGSKQYDGLYKGNKFRSYIVGGLPADEDQIEELKTPFGAVALNIIDGKPYIIRKGNLGVAIQASSAVPSLRKPVEMDGKLFVDGGLACNLPVKQCREMGADFVIAVNVDETFDKVPLDQFRAVGSVARRMVRWGLYDMDQPQQTMADITIHPDVNGISLISTSKKDAKRAVEAGEQAARLALPEIKRKLGL